MKMVTNLSRTLCQGFFGVVALGLGMFAQPALADNVDSTSSQPVQRVEITGSNIRRADAETPSPVQVISADDMKKSGYTTVSQVLQNITANGQGTLSNSLGNSFATGASGISLRGFNTGATLVLIDGHRMAPYPLPDNAQYSFVDISNIPFDTIERIEILKDGASAVYGSDAIAGVVNVILKKSFVGTKVNVDGGGTQQGGGSTIHASITSGFGDIDDDGYNVYGSVEYRHQNELTLASRLNRGGKQVFSQNYAPVGGVNNTPGVGMAGGSNSVFPVTNSPYLISAGATDTSGAVFGPGATCTTALLNSATGCPWIPHAQLMPETQNLNLLAGFNKKLSDGWTLNLKASLFQAKSDLTGDHGAIPTGYIQGAARTSGGLKFSASNPIPELVGPPSFLLTVPTTYPGNTTGGPAYVHGISPATPIAQTHLESKAYRLVGELSGSVANWDVNAALGWTKDVVHQNERGPINIPVLNAALNRASNPFDIFSGNNSAADMSAIFPNLRSDALSTLSFAEANASRSLMSLPGGDLGFSAGVSYVHRRLDQANPIEVAEGIVPGRQVYALGTQNNASAYVELVVPVHKTVELDFAERFDHIDNTGNAVTGKAAFKWTPTDAFALRGTASSGFRAPSVSEAGNTGSVGLFTQTNDPVNCPNGPGSNGCVIDFNGINYGAYIPTVLTVGNPRLQPERSSSFTLGTILEPIKGWSSTLDLFRITIRDQIVNNQPDYATAPSVRAATTTGNPATCSDGVGGTYACNVTPLIYIPNTYENANSTTVSGFELGSRYRFKLGSYGTLKTELDWTHYLSYKLAQQGQTYQLVGTHGPSAISNDTGNPQDRVQVVLDWAKGPLDIAATFNWTSSFSITDPSADQATCALATVAGGWFNSGATIPARFCKVASFLETDLSARYIVSKQWVIFGSITNVFNRAPPIDIETYGNNGIFAADQSLHMAGIIGRSFNVGASFIF